MRDRPAGAERCRNVHGFRQLGFSYARFDRLFAMYLDAVGALSRERDSDRHELFVLLRNGSIGKREFANVTKLTDV